MIYLMSYNLPALQKVMHTLISLLYISPDFLNVFINILENIFLKNGNQTMYTIWQLFHSAVYCVYLFMSVTI